MKMHCSAQRDWKNQMMLMRMMKRIVTMMTMNNLMTVEKPIDDSRVQSVSCWTTGPRSFPSTCAPSFDLDADHYGESRSGDLVHWVVAMKTNASIILCKKDVKLDQVYETFPARKKKHVHYKWNPTGLMWEGLQKMQIHQARADSACETDGQKAGRISRD